MKKQLLLTLLLMVTFVVCQNQGANASKKAVVQSATTLANFKFVFHAPLPKPVLQFVGGAIDPLDSTLVYDMYGSNPNTGLVSSLIIFKSGVQQSGTGITFSAAYNRTGGTTFQVTGTITRANSTTFSVTGTYDIS